MMNKKSGITFGLIASLCSVVLLAGCGSGSSGMPSDKVPATDSQGVPDYANSSNWLSLPANATKDVDVFFLGPTTYQKPNENSPNICAIDDAQMRSAAKAKFSCTATAFETEANIYSPYYRQSSADVLRLPPEQQSAIIEGDPTEDGLSAFDYYIKNLNNGRPFILAGHSQGSNVLIFMMADYMKQNPDVYKRMIAAYIIGYSVTPEYLAENPELEFASGPDDTRVIISYNTVSQNLAMPDPVVMPGAMVINPITWTREETLATAEQNLGGIEVDPKTGAVVVDSKGNPLKVEHYADAQVNTVKGVLVCSTANPGELAPGNQMVESGVYHPFDYPFYYFDIRENARNRIARYMKDK
ncbi:MAG: DUF3089 domain-containing protein [Actinobacteria bacterium]|nr:DUF3089 domain-containing protein [Actinomycetota bacterium]